MRCLICKVKVMMLVCVCVQSVMYSAEGELLFFSAAAAASMDQKQRSQRFYLQHRATVTAMAVNKVDAVVATGDQGELPCIRVWSSSSLQTLAVLEGFHRRAIAHLKFSSDGALLASVGWRTPPCRP